MFEKVKVKSLRYKTSELPDKAEVGFTLPALTAGIQNQGLNNYVPKDRATVLKNVISISANGANTGATFFQSKEFTVLQDAYAIEWIFSENILTENQYIFLTGSIAKTIYGNYEWTNKAGWEKIKSELISLPTKNDEIDFDFMESFIAELEAERIAALEAYLVAGGLKDYTLTKEEKKVLADFEGQEFSQFNIIDVFSVKNTGNILSRDIIENSGETPYLCASAENNSVSSYISYDENFLDKGNCVFIGGKTFVVSYQDKDFYSNDSHNLVLYLKNEEKQSKLNYLYMATCINKSLKHRYSWGDSISNKKIQTDKVTLPAQSDQPNYKKMEIFISAIKKMVIKDVVLYADKKITTTKKVMNNIK